MESSEDMKEAGERLLKLSEDEEAREIAEAREYSKWAYEHTLRATKERSRAEGEYSKAIEMAKNMLSDHLAIETISKYTGLAVNELLELDLENKGKSQ